MKLFDLHCDTLSELFQRRETLAENSCHISLARAADYADWRQVFAVWSRYDLTDEENYTRFFEILAYNTPLLLQAAQSGAVQPYLGVEGGGLLVSSLSRLDALYAAGVRILTLTWAGENCIGGSHDTETGLTPFGRAVLARCFTLGILPDLSHASDPLFWDAVTAAKCAGKPIIASHSDCRALCAHRRDLSDGMLRALFACDSLCGLNLCPHFLCDDGKADAARVADHALRMLSLGGKGKIALGCDLDGTDLPEGFGGIDDLYRIADALAARSLGDREIEAIFFGNASAFFDRHGIAPLFPAAK